MKKLLLLIILTIVMSLTTVSATPTQTGTISDMNLEYGESAGFDLTNFFSGYDTAIINYADPFDSISVQISESMVQSTADPSFYNNGEVNVQLYEFGDLIFFQVNTQDLASTSQTTFSTTITLTMEDGTGSTSTTFDVTVTEPNVPPPTQVSSIPDLNLEGNDQSTYSMVNYFSDFNDITIAFTDPTTTLEETITATAGTADLNGYTTNDIGMQLYATTNNVFLAMVAENKTWDTNIQVTASNTEGSISDTFNLATTPTTSGGGGGSGGTIPDPANNVAYWALEDLTDLTGNGNTLTIPGGTADPTSGVTGIIDNAYSFDGTNDYMSIDGTVIGSNRNEIAISFWIKTTAITYDYFVGNVQNTNKDTIIIRLNADNSKSDSSGNIAYFLRDSNSDVLRGDLGVNTGFNDGNWHHIVINIDHSNNLFEVYVDETSYTGTNAQADSPSVFADFSLPTALGAFNSDGSISAPYYDGDIDEVSIFDFTLNSSEVDYLYNSGSPGSAQQYDFTSAPATPAPSVNQSFTSETLGFNDITVFPLEYYFDNFGGVTLDWTDPISSTPQQLSTSKGGSDDTYTSSGYDVELRPTSDGSDVILQLESKGINFAETIFTITVDNTEGMAQNTLGITVDGSQFSQIPTVTNPLLTNYQLNKSQTLTFDFENIYNDYNKIAVVINEIGGEQIILDDFNESVGIDSFQMYNGNLGTYRISTLNAGRVGTLEATFAEVTKNEPVDFLFIPNVTTGQFSVELRAGNDLGYTTQTSDVQIVEEAVAPPTNENETNTTKSLFDKLIDQVGNVFPTQENLTQSKKWGYVLVTILIITLLIVLILVSSGVPPSITGYVSIAINLLLFFYFVVIGYIPTSVLVVVGLIILSLSFIKFRSSMGRG